MAKVQVEIYPKNLPRLKQLSKETHISLTALTNQAVEHGIDRLHWSLRIKKLLPNKPPNALRKASLDSSIRRINEGFKYARKVDALK